MPYRIAWEPAGVLREYLGDVSLAERRESLERICADERFDSLRYAITDYRDVGQYEMSPATTEEFAAMHVGPLITNPRVVIAAVVTRADIAAAIREFIGHGYVDRPYRIFSTMPAAREWIDMTLRMR